MCKTVHTANQISPQYVVWQKETKNRLHLRVNTCCLKNRRKNFTSEGKFYGYLTIPLHYIGFKVLFYSFCGVEGESSSDLQASTQLLNSTSHILLSAFIFKQAFWFSLQLLMHFCTLICSAIEMSEKEKIKKYKTMTKHEIRGNVLNRFIMPPPSIYRYVFIWFWTNQI